MKIATVYRRGERIFVHSSSRTTAGVWVLTDPVLAVDGDNPARLGGAVLDALGGSREGVNHPTSWKGIFDPVLRLAKARSWNTFAESAKCVEVEFEGDTISIFPTRNLGSRDGFERIPGKSKISGPTVEEVGAATLQALRDAE